MESNKLYFEKSQARANEKYMQADGDGKTTEIVVDKNAVDAINAKLFRERILIAIMFVGVAYAGFKFGKYLFTPIEKAIK